MIAMWRVITRRIGFIAVALGLWPSSTSFAQRRFSAGPARLSSPSTTDLAAFSPDGKIWARDGGSGKVVLWDLAAQKEIATLNHPGSVGHLGFSPDGQTLVGWFIAHRNDENDRVVLWNLATFEKRSLGTWPAKKIREMAFSPSGAMLATVSFSVPARRGDGKFPGATTEEVKIWDVSSGREVKLLDESKLAYVAFSPNGRWLATAHTESLRSGQVILWDAATLEPVRKLKTDGGSFRPLAFSADSRLIAASFFRPNEKPDGKTGVMLWDLETGKVKGRLPGISSSGLPQEGTLVAFAPDGLRLVVLKRNLSQGRRGFGQSGVSEVHLWDRTSGEDKVLDVGQSGDLDARFSPDCRYLATTFYAREGAQHQVGVKLWDTKYWRLARTLSMASEGDAVVARSRGDAWQPRFAPDGRWLSAILQEYADKNEFSFYLWELPEKRDAATGDYIPGSDSR